MKQPTHRLHLEFLYANHAPKFILRSWEWTNHTLKRFSQNCGTTTNWQWWQEVATNYFGILWKSTGMRQSQLQLNIKLIQPNTIKEDCLIWQLDRNSLRSNPQGTLRRPGNQARKQFLCMHFKQKKELRRQGRQLKLLLKNMEWWIISIICSNDYVCQNS